MPSVSGNVGAVFNGGTISGAVDVAYTGAAATTPLKVVGSADQTPANDWQLVEIDDGNGALRLSLESNGALNVRLDTGNGATFSVADPANGKAALSIRGTEVRVGDGIVDTAFVVNQLPIADPHVVGQLWNSSGVVHVSAGP